MKLPLHANIKMLRQQFGLSQVDFGQRLNVTKQCVSNWENDNVVPSIDMLVKIADFFNVSTDYLLGRESKQTASLDGLTDDHAAHIRLLIGDLKNL